MKWRRNFVGKPPNRRHVGWYVPEDETRGFGWDIEITPYGYALTNGSCMGLVATFKRLKDARHVAEYIEEHAA